MPSKVEDQVVSTANSMRAAYNNWDHQVAPHFLIQDPEKMSEDSARRNSQARSPESTFLTQNLYAEIAEGESTPKPNTLTMQGASATGKNSAPINSCRLPTPSSIMVKQIVENQNVLLWQAFEAWRQKFPRPHSEMDVKVDKIRT